MIQPLLSVEEFRIRSKAHQKAEQLGWCGVFLPLPVGYGLITQFEWLDLLGSPLEFVFWAILAGLGAVSMFSILSFGRVEARYADLKCPYCSEALYNHRTLVICSRNCPECGREVLLPPESDSPPSPNDRPFNESPSDVHQPA